MLYQKLIKPILFLFDPERVHHFVFWTIKKIHFIPGIPSLVRARYRIQHPKLERQLFGLRFPNPVGLAAGFDKDAKLYQELSNFGFGIGDVKVLGVDTRDRGIFTILTKDNFGGIEGKC